MNSKPKFEHLSVYKYKPGQSGNVNGRPKSYITVLKELGYTKPVVATMVAEIMFMPAHEVYNLAYSKTEPVIRRGIAYAFYRYATTGEFKYVSDLTELLFGRNIPYIPEAPLAEDKEPE